MDFGVIMSNKTIKETKELMEGVLLNDGLQRSKNS